MVTTIIIVTYIWNLFSIKHYWFHNLVKIWASFANIRRMRVLQILDILEIKANLNNILTWISQLEVWNVCQYVCDAQRDVPVLIWSKCVRWEKMATFWGRGNLEINHVAMVTNLQMITYF